MKKLISTALLALLVTSGHAQVELFPATETVEITADSSLTDSDTGRTEFIGFRISWGATSIASDLALSESLDYANNTMVLSGNVTIDSPEVRLQADSLELSTEEGVVVSAVFKGAPLSATFASTQGEETTELQADYLSVDRQAETVLVKGNAVFTNASRTLEAESMVIYRQDGRVVAESGNRGESRVRFSIPAN